MTRYVKVNPRAKVETATVTPVALTPAQLQAGNEWLRLYDIWDGLCRDTNAETADIKQARMDMMGAWTAIVGACGGDMDMAQNSVRRARLEYNTWAKANGLRTLATPSLQYYDPAKWAGPVSDPVSMSEE